MLGLGFGPSTVAAQATVAPSTASPLMLTMEKMRGSVVAVGYFAPLANPRFRFRGTGWAAGDGRQVVTNSHVLDEDGNLAEGERLMVMVAPAGRGRQASEPRSATVVRRVPELDLAVLQVDGPPLPPLRLGTTPAQEGQEVALVGFPLGGILGLVPTVHRAIVSSVVSITLPAATSQGLRPRMIAQLRAGLFEIYQLDARAHPGNSGGPLIDPSSGDVLGVINMTLVSRSREAMVEEHSGISFAIPVAQVRPLLGLDQTR